MSTIIAYLGLAFAAWVFSQWSWNRAAVIGGAKISESPYSDLLFAIAVPVAIVAARALFCA